LFKYFSKFAFVSLECGAKVRKCFYIRILNSY
jgi:hypothetical protein